MSNAKTSEVDLAEAVVRGMKAEVEVEPLAALVAFDLARAASQWREKLGWRAKFHFEQTLISVDKSLGFHIYVERLYWWQSILRISLSPNDIRGPQHIGLVCFCPLQQRWTIAVDPAGVYYQTLPTCLEGLFAKREVGKILVELFGTKCLKRKEPKCAKA